MELKKHYSPDKTYEPFFTGGVIKLSEDAQFLFCQCESSVKVVELSTLKTQHSLEEDEDTVTCFSVGGEVLVAGWRSLLLRQYSWRDGKLTRQWKGHIGPVMSMDFDHTSTLLATGSSDGVIKVWDCEKQYCTHNLKDYSGVVSLVQFHPAKLILFSSASDNKIKAWDLKSSSCKYTLDGHVSAVTSLAFSNDGAFLLSGGRDNVVNMWSVPKGERITTLPVYESIEGIVSLTKSKVVIATAGNKGVVNLWDVSKGTLLGSAPPLGQNIEYTDLQYCKQLNCLVGVASDQSIVLYDEDNLSLLRNYIGYLDEILDIKCTDKYIATATNSELIKVFDCSDGNCTVLTGHRDTVMSIDVSSDGGTLVSGSKDNIVLVWKLIGQTYRCCGEGRGHTLSVGAVACARLCSLVPFVVSGSQDRTIKLWDTLSLQEESIDPVRLSVKCTCIAHDKDINSVDISPNNKLVVSGSQDRTAKIWQVDGLKLHGTLTGHKRGVWSVQFSPVDQCVLTSSADSTVKLWSIIDLSCLKTFEGHNTSVLKAIFITQGMQFVSGDNYGVIKLWNIKSQECISTMDRHTDRVWALASVNDGQTIVSGGADSTICQWKDVTEQVEADEQALKEGVIIREQELMNYLHQKDFVRAVSVALSLDQPYRVLKILKDMLADDGMKEKFETTIVSLSKDDKQTLLRYVNKWNTNSKHCRVAQSVLNVVLKTTRPEEIVEMEGLSELLRGLIPYTERHFQRLTKTKQLASFLEYTWQCMKLPAGEGLAVVTGKSKSDDTSEEMNCS